MFAQPEPQTHLRHVAIWTVDHARLVVMVLFELLAPQSGRSQPLASPVLPGRCSQKGSVAQRLRVVPAHTRPRGQSLALIRARALASSTPNRSLQGKSPPLGASERGVDGGARRSRNRAETPKHSNSSPSCNQASALLDRRLPPTRAATFAPCYFLGSCVHQA